MYLIKPLKEMSLSIALPICLVFIRLSFVLTFPQAHPPLSTLPNSSSHYFCLFFSLFLSCLPPCPHYLKVSFLLSSSLKDSLSSVALSLPLFLFHLHYFVRSSSSLALHATLLCFHLLMASSRLSSNPTAGCICSFSPKLASLHPLSVCFLHFLSFSTL